MVGLKHVVAVSVLATTLAAATAAQAGFVTGWDLLQICKANPQQGGYGIHTAQCRGYVSGVSNTFDCKEALHGFHWNRAAGVATEDVVKTVITWFNAHPKTLKHEADGLVAAALGEAYPCK